MEEDFASVTSQIRGKKAAAVGVCQTVRFHPHREARKPLESSDIPPPSSGLSPLWLSPVGEPLAAFARRWSYTTSWWFSPTTCLPAVEMTLLSCPRFVGTSAVPLASGRARWRSIQPTRVRARADQRLPGGGIKTQIIQLPAGFGLEHFPWIQPGVCVFSQPAFSLLDLVLLLCHSVSCCKQKGVRSRKSWY